MPHLPAEPGTMEQPYTYSPLSPSSNHDEIRILELLPGTGADTVVAKLIHHEVGVTATKYEALSYAWGTSATRHTVILDGRASTVGYNLYTALLHLRHPDRSKNIWVDYLCINQKDAVEKTKQIH